MLSCLFELVSEIHLGVDDARLSVATVILMKGVVVVTAESGTLADFLISVAIIVEQHLIVYRALHYWWGSVRRCQVVRS